MYRQISRQLDGENLAEGMKKNNNTFFKKGQILRSLENESVMESSGPTAHSHLPLLLRQPTALRAGSLGNHNKHSGQSIFV